jgi:predicted amidophosphoribosyltransferase
MESVIEDMDPRIAREWKTVEAMIGIYCHGRHGTAPDLCPECQGLADYARQRLLRCPFQEKKPTCANCAVHCYKPAMRDKVRAVMRYAGPRMMYRHPLLALHHLIDGRKKAPGRFQR